MSPRPTGRLWLPLLVLLAASCKSYDYDEEFFLEVDGSGEFRVSGTRELLESFHRLSTVTPETVASHFDGPSLTSISVRESVRDGQPFIHLTSSFSSFTDLCGQRAFAVRSCRLVEHGDELSMEATIPAPAPHDGVAPGALIAFRFHLPSQVSYHNSPEGVMRGNILGWEQTYGDLLVQPPLRLEARFGRQSVMAATLRILLMAAAVVVTALVAAFAWMMRKGRRQLAADQQSQ